MLFFRTEDTSIPSIARKLNTSNSVNVNIDKIVRNMDKDYYKNFFSGNPKNNLTKTEFEQFAKSNILKKVFEIASSDVLKYDYFWRRPETKILLMTQAGKEFLQSDNGKVFFQLHKDIYGLNKFANPDSLIRSRYAISTFSTQEGQMFLKSQEGKQFLDKILRNEPVLFFSMGKLLQTPALEDYLRPDEKINEIVEIAKNKNKGIYPIITTNDFIWYLQYTPSGLIVRRNLNNFLVNEPYFFSRKIEYATRDQNLKYMMENSLKEALSNKSIYSGGRKKTSSRKI